MIGAVGRMRTRTFRHTCEADGGDEENSTINPTFLLHVTKGILKLDHLNHFKFSMVIKAPPLGDNN